MEWELGAKGKVEAKVGGPIEDAPLEPAATSLEDALANADKRTEAKPQAINLNDEGDGEKPRRGRRKKSDLPVDGMPELFSQGGVGTLWVKTWNGIFHACEAAPFTEEEAKQQAAIFAYWCKKRLPEAPEKYQPDLLLAATLLVTLIPRIPSIAKKTAPWWLKAWNKIRGKAPDGE